MKKAFYFISIFALLVCISLPASAWNNERNDMYTQFSFYGVYTPDQEFTAGGSSSDVEYDFGLGLGASLGYIFNDNFRAEGEFAYRENEFEVSGEKYRSYAFMVNGIFDFEGVNNFNPYLGGGIGLAHMKSDNYDDDVFAYQLMFGVAYDMDFLEFPEDMSIIFGYRYFSAEDAEYGLGELSYDNHNIELGFNIKF